MTAGRESRAKVATAKRRRRASFHLKAESNITFRTLAAERALASEPQEALGTRPNTKATAILL